MALNKRAGSPLCAGFLLGALGVGNTAYAQQPAETPPQPQTVSATLPQPVILQAKLTSYVNAQPRIMSFTQPVASMSDCMALSDQYRRRYLIVLPRLEGFEPYCILPEFGTQPSRMIRLQWSDRTTRHSFNTAVDDQRLNMHYNNLQAYTLTLINYDRYAEFMSSVQVSSLDACLSVLEDRERTQRLSLNVSTRAFCTDNRAANGPVPQRFMRLNGNLVARDGFFGARQPAPVPMQ